MLSLILTGLAVVVAVSGEDCTQTTCNTGLNKYYRELNCTPVQESGACCPSRFDCSAALANRDDDKCYLNGRSYTDGARLTDEEAGNKCVANCLCQKTGPQANIQCAHIECPSLFNGPPAPGCVQLYTHDQCCSTGTHCTNATKPAAKEAFKCEHAGKSYVVGQKFWPEEEPCMTCICQTGYDGTLNGPWCSEVNCGIEIHYGSKIKEGCAPVHFGKKGCCPIGWRCPESSDTVVRPENAATTKDAAECVFGKLRLKVSETLNPESECSECKCTVPPHVSCVQTGNC